MTKRMKKANNFQIVKFQSHGAAWLLRNFFCQFQHSVAYKSVAYKKNVQSINSVVVSTPQKLYSKLVYKPV